MINPSHLVAIDWGTTSLRGALMSSDGRILQEQSSPDGILKVRAGGFPALFARAFSSWLAEFPGAAVLASGMVGSRQGWVEAPYVPCPAGFDALAQGIVMVDAGSGVRMGIVPGLKFESKEGAHPAFGAPDVMRGEETQIFGAMAELGLSDGSFILPGTHSKWACVEAGQIVRFETYMTGELFAVLCQHSILGRLMPGEGQAAATPFDQAAFNRGVEVSMSNRQGALLHTLFSARTLGLFETLCAVEIPNYLSGLLIGEEIREALALNGDGATAQRALTIVGRGDLAARYQSALASCGRDSVIVEGAATFRGLNALAKAAGLVG